MVKLNKTGLLGFQQNAFTQNQMMVGAKVTTRLSVAQESTYSSDKKLDGLASNFVKCHARVGIKVGVKIN